MHGVNLEFIGVALHPSQTVLTVLDFSVTGAVMVVVVLVDVVVTNVAVTGWFTMVANGVILDIFFVTNGVVIDIVTMTDIMCVIKHAISLMFR